MLLLLVLCAFVAFYFYVKSCNNYWKRRGVHQVPTNLFFGQAFDFLRGRRSIEQVYENLYATIDPDVRYLGTYNYMKPMLFIRDAELIHRMSVNDFNHFHDRQKPTKSEGRLVQSVITLAGDDWKDARNKLIPCFSASKMKRMYCLIEECVELLIDQHLRPAAKFGKPIDVRETIVRFTLDTIGKCAFGLQFNTLNESDNLYRKTVGQAFNASGFLNSLRFVLSFLNPNLLKLFRMTGTSDEVENFFFELLRNAEAIRQKEKEHRGDFLQLMLDIKEESGNKAKHLFTDNHIASNMSVFYFAGHETTALTITFALYELSMNSDIQEKLRQEIKRALDANNGVMDYKTVQDMEYLEMVLSETLRLHAPVPFSSRLCTETYQVPGTSFKIKAGETMLFSRSALHKDEKYFPDPLKFDPERFSPKNVAQMNPHVYQPFGVGPRICLGLRFAKLEIKICLASIISRFKFLRCSKTEVPIVLQTSPLFHSPKNGIWLVVEEL